MQTTQPAKDVIHTFPNGRTYKVVDTRKPYEHGEYPSGGFLITTLLLQSKQWSFIDHAPDQECVDNFLRAAARLPQLKN